MIATLKTLHFLAFSLGIGGGMASVMAGLAARRAEPEARAVIARLRRRIGLVAALVTAILAFTPSP
jgi:hypothetical protein